MTNLAKGRAALAGLALVEAAEWCQEVINVDQVQTWVRDNCGGYELQI